MDEFFVSSILFILPTILLDTYIAYYVIYAFSYHFFMPYQNRNVIFNPIIIAILSLSARHIVNTKK